MAGSHKAATGGRDSGEITDRGFMTSNYFAPSAVSDFR
jgi:hypothetical protein